MNVSSVRRLVTWAVVWAVIVVMLLGLKAGGLEVIDLFKDTIELREDDRTLPWKGALGVIGAGAWFVAAGVALFAAWTLDPTDRRRRYLRATAGVLTALGLDDALAVHDHLVPYVTGSSGAEKVVLTALVAVVGSWAVGFRSRLMASDRVLLGMSSLGPGARSGSTPCSRSASPSRGSGWWKR